MKLSFLIILIVLFSFSVFGNNSKLWGELEKGKYSIGFKEIYLVDKSRKFPIEGNNINYKGRPLRILFWYPSYEKSNKHLKVVDYLNSEPSDKRYIPYYKLLRKKDLSTLLRNSHSDREKREIYSKKFLNADLKGNYSLEFPQEKFPLIIYGLGRNNYQLENIILWEYLASHGYVIAVPVQQGESSKNNRISFEFSALNNQKKDFLFTLNQTIEYPIVDKKKIIAMGHSSGAVLAFLAALENKKIKTIVSLDGSINTNDGVELFEANKIKTNNLKAKTLNLYNLNKRSLNMKILNELTSSKVTNIGFTKATHFDFQIYPLYPIVTKSNDKRINWGRPAEIGIKNYSLMSRNVLNYLNATFGNKKTFENYLSKINKQKNGLIKVK